jgi:hypothetical protein
MSITATIDTRDWQQFEATSLDELNQASSMMVRLDNKYLLREPVLKLALEQFAHYFHILEIDRHRVFTYESCYFDDQHLRCYYDHHQGRRQRMKVRTRKYLESNLCFVEVKLKNSRGVTIKKRRPHALENFGILDANAMQYVKDEYFALYGRSFSEHLFPTLNMTYGRATLVAKQGGERITIDKQIRFQYNQKSFSTPDDIFVIETKSANGNGIADAILRRFHQHTSNKCSKYCVGMCLTEQVSRYNNFMPTLRQLGALPTKLLLPAEDTKVLKTQIDKNLPPLTSNLPQAI